MNSVIEEHASIRFRAEVPLGRAFDEAFVEENANAVAATNETESPDRAFFDKPLHGDILRVAAHLESQAEPDPGALHRAQNAITIFERGCHRLLQQDGLARLYCRHAEIGVSVRFTGDDDAVYIRSPDNVFEVRRVGNIKGCGVLFAAFLVIVPARDQLRIVEVLDAVRISVDVPMRKRKNADSQSASHVAYSSETLFSCLHGFSAGPTLPEKQDDSRILDINPDRALFDFGGVGGDAGAKSVLHLSSFDVDLPGMIRAGDHIPFHISLAERPVPMRTLVIQAVVFAIHIKKRVLAVICPNDSRLAWRKAIRLDCFHERHSPANPSSYAKMSVIASRFAVTTWRSCPNFSSLRSSLRRDVWRANGVVVNRT
jgi:hypothetical protein